MKMGRIAAAAIASLALSVPTSHALKGQVTGMTKIHMTCYNFSLIPPQTVSGPLPTNANGRFDCRNFGLIVQPGDNLRVTLSGTADHLPIILYVPEFDPIEYVECINKSRNNKLTWVGDAYTSTACTPLPVEPGHKYTVAARGTYNPLPVSCPCFDSVRFNHLTDLTESLPNTGFNGPICAYEPDVNAPEYVEWLLRDRTYFIPELLILANSGTNRCIVSLTNHNGQTLVLDEQPITQAEFAACHDLIVQHCPPQ